ncbi:MAG TPA: DUF296 domain-containing protein [Acetobacteraceae bacterium]|nr:DUF296 domain-containing protein [Acetobacteraceae bacterium]
MRRLRQPGPAAPERIESVACHGRAIEFMLEPGLSLNEALTRPLIAAGMRSGSLSFAGGAFGPFSYVTPGPPRDAQHVAYFSDPRSPGEARVEIANATFGWRDGVPFVHCHGAWIEPDGSRSGGHVLPHETVIAEGSRVRAWGVADVTIRAEPDPETNFTLFHPVATDAPTPSARFVVARICPNEEIGAALSELCRRHGLAQAIVRGSLGSLIGARFADGGEVTDHATEVLVRSGRCGPGSDAELDMVVVDMQGMVHDGRLQAGENAVCITFELMIEAV